MIAYKFLCPEGTGRFSGFAWPRPGGGAPGAWVVADGPAAACRCGVHACTVEGLTSWIDEELWRVELAGVTLAESGVLVAERGRLLERLAAWTPRTARELAEATALRTRDRAVEALSRAGLAVEAAELDGADDLDTVQTIAARLASRVDGDAGALCAFAADAVALLHGARPDEWTAARSGASVPDAAIAANLCFVVAHAAGQAAVAEHGDLAAYDRGFAAERETQRRWLVERLGLGD